MNKQTLVALKKSIAMWERRAKGETIRVNRGNCALCELFNAGPTNKSTDCVGCPVHEITREKYCYGTMATREYTSETARAEVNFLRALLPPSERRRPRK